MEKHNAKNPQAKETPSHRHVTGRTPPTQQEIRIQLGWALCEAVRNSKHPR